MAQVYQKAWHTRHFGEMAMTSDASDDLIALTASIVSSHVASNKVATSELPGLIQSIYSALASLGAPIAPPVPEKPKGAIGIRASIRPGRRYGNSVFYGHLGSSDASI